MRLRLFAIMTIAGLFVACGSGDKTIEVYTIKKETPKPAPVAAPPKATGLQWDVPSNWQETPASAMHLAAYNVPIEGAESPASLTLMTLPGDGGGLLMNVNRWLNQLGLAPVQASDLSALGEAHDAKIGPFSLFTFKNEASPEKAFLVSVYQTSSQTHFVKLIAPMASLESLKPVFLEFCQTVSTDS